MQVQPEFLKTLWHFRFSCYVVLLPRDLKNTRDVVLNTVHRSKLGIYQNIFQVLCEMIRLYST